MSDRVTAAAKVIDKWQCDNTSHGTPEQLARALDEAGLLVPEMRVEESHRIINPDHAQVRHRLAGDRQ